MEPFPVTRLYEPVGREPRILLMDASAPRGYLGLFCGTNPLGECWLEGARRHVSDLAPGLESLLKKAGWKPTELDAIAVGIGPGSYTGLRVAIMSARTLALVTGAPLLGLGNFQILAQGLPATAPQTVECIADAQQDKIYRQYFQRQGEWFLPTDPMEITDCNQWLKRRNPAVPVCGPGLEKLRRLDLAPPQYLECPQLQPLAFIRLALRELSQGRIDDPHALEPLYLRRSSAEEQWDRRITS